MACDRPIYVKKNKYLPTSIPVMCGKCPPCLKRRVDSWVFRLQQEEKNWKYSHFVTLTYDTDHVPLSHNGFMTLRKKQIQDFLKRLRKLQNEKLVYYIVGEYGEANHRPHYHGIFFNVQSAEFYSRAWALKNKQFGHIDIAGVSGDSIAYTCKYMQKKRRKKKHGRCDWEREFSLMSQHIGANYLTEKIINYHKSRPNELFLTLRGGYRIAMPKYYRDKIFSEHEKFNQIHHIKEVLSEKQNEEILECKKNNVDYDRYKHIQEMNRTKIYNKSRKKRKL